MSNFANIHQVQVTPIITEKSLADAKKGKFTFAVGRSIRKDSIRSEIEKRFTVKVVGIATSIIKGKKKRTGTKRLEKEEKVWKKAIVKLEPGQTITVFGVQVK